MNWLGTRQTPGQLVLFWRDILVILVAGMPPARTVKDAVRFRLGPVTVPEATPEAAPGLRLMEQPPFEGPNRSHMDTREILTPDLKARAMYAEIFALYFYFTSVNLNVFFADVDLGFLNANTLHLQPDTEVKLKFKRQCKGNRNQGKYLNFQARVELFDATQIQFKFIS